MFKSALLPTLAAGAIAALATAAAADPINAITVHGRLTRGDVKIESKAVGFRDLDVYSPDGARILFHRINVAAEDVCNPDRLTAGHLREYRDLQDYMDCKNNAIDLAVADVNSPALSNYRASFR